jgi:hypothetical protein
MRIFCPTYTVNVVGSIEGLRASKVGISVPNRVAIALRLSPSWTVYSKGPEGVGVSVGVAVSVGKEVAVSVGVLVGGFGVAVSVAVAVKVIVGVGVGDFNGELSPNSQKINAAAPAMSSTAAPIMTTIGVL